MSGTSLQLHPQAAAVYARPAWQISRVLNGPCIPAVVCAASYTGRQAAEQQEQQSHTHAASSQPALLPRPAKQAEVQRNVVPFQHTGSASKQQEHAQHPQQRGGNSVAEQDKARQSLNWTKQWYPVMGVQDLDQGRPHAFQLLGKHLMLWHDRNASESPAWRCFEDSCPHRRVPLSEGRIEADGTLACCYHGWRFSGDGHAVHIPAMNGNTKAEEQVCKNECSSVAAHPVEVRHGLLFVWGEAGAMAMLESQSRPCPVGAMHDFAPEGELVSAYSHYVRDLPGSFDVWVENMADQSHVAFAHHGAVGNRYGKAAGRYQQKVVSIPERPQDGFEYSFDWSGDSNKMTEATEFKFTPPCLASMTLDGHIGGLWIYAVPVNSNTTRIIINAGRKVGPKALASFLQKLVPRWFMHLQLNAINDGDIVFMHRQAEANRKARLAADGSFSWHKHYFLPGENDRGVMGWRQWLDERAGGGPFGAVNAEPTFGLNAFGKADRRQLLDRRHQHTDQCTSCSKVLAGVKTGQQAALAVAAVSFLATASQLHVGGDAIMTSIGVLAGLGLHRALLQAEKPFVYTDWVNQDKA